MASRLTAACVQISAGNDIGTNLSVLREMVWSARDDGAEFILTPENALLMESRRGPKLAQAEDEAQPRLLPLLAELAREAEAWLLIGSIAVRLPGDDRLANRSYLFDRNGDIAARYDKIHMFDVDLANGESYRESAQYRPGDAAVLAETEWGPVGMTICYDLRFGALHRRLAQAGAVMLTVPSAFTVPTGRAHWHTLLRARAIETGCFVLAPAQTGTHADGRSTFGHSLIVAPWGDVLADAGERPGHIVAELDLERVEEARRMVPSLRHDRLFALPGEAVGRS